MLEVSAFAYVPYTSAYLHPILSLVNFFSYVRKSNILIDFFIHKLKISIIKN